MENVIVDLPVSKEKATIRGFISGKDQLDFRTIVFEAMKLDEDGVQDAQLNPILAQRAYDMLIQNMIVNLGALTGVEAYAKLLELPAKDYEAVFAKVVEIYQTNIEETEKKD